MGAPKVGELSLWGGRVGTQDGEDAGCKGGKACWEEALSRWVKHQRLWVWYLSNFVTHLQRENNVKKWKVAFILFSMDSAEL